MDVGKLPSQLLAHLLARIGPYRSGRVVVGPGVGQDAAVIDMGDRLLVAKSDPITFASDLIGWYAVHVNANDVACMGARPAWFLATILLPEGAAPSLAEAIFEQVLDACQAMEIELVGGHFEITYGLERPIVVGAMLGEVERGRLVRSSGAQPGDCLILTKGIAIEGTAVLAREAGEALAAAGGARRRAGGGPRLHLPARAQRRARGPAGRGIGPRPRHARPHRGRPGHRPPRAGDGRRRGAGRAGGGHRRCCPAPTAICRAAGPRAAGTAGLRRLAHRRCRPLTATPCWPAWQRRASPLPASALLNTTAKGL